MLSNVKATVRKNSVQVEFENGSIQDFSKKQIRTVKFIPVIWKIRKALTVENKPEALEEQKKREQEEEKNRLREATVEGNEWVERPEEDQISP